MYVDDRKPAVRECFKCYSSNVVVWWKNNKSDIWLKVNNHSSSTETLICCHTCYQETLYPIVEFCPLCFSKNITIKWHRNNSDIWKQVAVVKPILRQASSSSSSSSVETGREVWYENHTLPSSSNDDDDELDVAAINEEHISWQEILDRQQGNDTLLELLQEAVGNTDD